MEGKIEDKVSFSDRQLWSMILPLFTERLLLMLVGIVDSFIISYAGEEAVSGVSLVNQFNNVFLMLSTAMAAGGAVVISHYIGDRQKEQADRSAGQLLMFAVLFTSALALMVRCFDAAMLSFLFGKVAPEVMEASIIYLRISVWSYPAQAIYDAGAALYRSMGRTKTTMKISLQSNLINVVGNVIGVFVLHMGVAGVAVPTLMARVYSAVAITWLCFNRENTVCYSMKNIFRFDLSMLRRIIGIALPNGVENGAFQLVKVAMSSIVAGFGTYQIAANGVAQNIWSFSNAGSNSMGPVFITVIGQCMGARQLDSAEHYYKKLLGTTIKLSLAWNFLITAATPVMLHFYNLSPETKTLIFQVVLMHNVFNTIIAPAAMPLGAGLRAAGDVKYTTTVALIASTILRLSLSFILGKWMGLGLVGITIAMISDWVFRAVGYLWRLRSGRWKEHQVI